MAIDLSVINSERITDVNKRLVEIMQRGLTDSNIVELDGVKVPAADKDAYKTLIRLRDLLSRKTDDKITYNFGDIAYVAENDVEIVYLYQSGLGLDVPKSLARRGFIPGAGIATPLPKRVEESFDEYEAYLKQYYASHGISVGVGSDGLREPYPHEKFKWVAGKACVPAPEENYVDEYYSYYRNMMFGRHIMNGMNNTNRRSNNAQPNAGQPQQGQPQQGHPQQGQPQQGRPQQGRPQQGQPVQPNNGQRTNTGAPTNGGNPVPGAGTPTGSRRTAPNGRCHFRRRRLSRLPEDRHGFFDRIFGGVYNFNHAAASPGVTRNYKKILKIVGLILGAAALCFVAGHVVLPFLGVVIDSFAKAFAIGNAAQIGSLISKVVLIGLGTTLAIFFAKYIKKRKALKGGEEGTPGGEEGGTTPPAGPDSPEAEPPSFDNPAQFIAYVKQRMVQLNNELAALDAEEMNLKNPGPISDKDQERINRKRALIQDARNKLMDMMLTFNTANDINQDRAMGGR